MDESEPVPLPPPEASSLPNLNEKRLWIGNLDSKLREFQLLKMVEKFGTLLEFDFLYHRSGPQAGQPRGYAFVTFEKYSSAHSALKTLDGLEVCGRRVAVKWAHAQDEYKYENTKSRPAPSILSAGSSDKTKESSKAISKMTKIAALEAKLKLLDRNTSDINLQPDVGSDVKKPTNVTYAFIEKKSKDSHGSISSSKKYKTSTPFYKHRNKRK